MAPKYKLTYFNVKGLGEPIRFLLSYGGVEFEDIRVESQSEEWQKMKSKTPFGKLPLLEVDGKQIYQSMSICRYLGKQFGLAGSDDWEALQIDAVVDTLIDYKILFQGFRNDEDPVSKAKKKEHLIKEVIPFYTSKFEELVKKNNGYFVNGKLSWADIYFTAVLSSFKYSDSFNLTENSPNLEALVQKVLSIPSIKSWVDKHP